MGVAEQQRRRQLRAPAAAAPAALVAAAVEVVAAAAAAAAGGAPAAGGQQAACATPVRRDRLDASHADGRRSDRRDAAGGAGQRGRSLRKLDKIGADRGQGGRRGSGVRFSHNSNAAHASRERYSRGRRHGHVLEDRQRRFTRPGKVDAILQKDGVNAYVAEGSAGIVAREKAAHRDLRTVGRQYRRGLDSLDSGAVPLPVHACCTTPTFRSGHLRDQFDTIVFAEMGTRQIMDGMQAGHGARAVRGRHRRRGRGGAARFRDEGRHAGRVRQRHAVRHRPIQSAGDERGGGVAAESVLLLRLAAENRDQGAEASGGCRAAADGRR